MRSFLMSWSGNCWINPMSSLFLHVRPFFLRPSEIILFTYCLSWVILRARVCLLSTAVLTAGNGVTYGYIP